jgi:hypothetical protein
MECSQYTGGARYLVLVFSSWRSSCTSPGFSALIHHRIQTDETNYKNVFLQPDHTPSNHPLPMPYAVAVVTILWPFVRTFFETLVSWAEKFPATFFRQTRIWNTNRRYWTLHLSRGMLTQQWRTEMHLSSTTRWFISQACYRRRLKLHSRLKRVSINGRVIRSVFGSYIPLTTLCYFYWWGSLKNRVYKTILTISKNLESDVRFQQFPARTPECI